MVLKIIQINGMGYSLFDSVLDMYCVMTYGGSAYL